MNLKLYILLQLRWYLEILVLHCTIVVSASASHVEHFVIPIRKEINSTDNTFTKVEKLLLQTMISL